MYLLVAATEFEMEPARKSLASSRNVSFLVSGVGQVESAFALTRYLSLNQDISVVVNLGVAGAYHDCGLDLLRICLAGKEILADFGICYPDRIESFSSDNMTISREFDLKNKLFFESRKILEYDHLPFDCGTFLTVSCVSGTASRGSYLKQTFDAICENMEGAALARVCQGFGVDLLELRCISNMVEDRDPSRWRLREACENVGDAAARVIHGLSDVEWSYR
ncbi:MAG: futalosine hydrolase [Pseudomonadota bacterium]